MSRPTPQNNRGKAGHGVSDHATAVLLATLADTTWRMFVPVFVLAGAGMWLDVKLETMPWLTLVGLVIGLGVAVWLIRAQLREVALDDMPVPSASKGGNTQTPKDSGQGDKS